MVRYSLHSRYAIVLLANSDSELLRIVRPSVGCAAQDTDPLGKGDKLRHGLDLHFFHHLLAVSLDGALRRSQFKRNLPVEFAAHDKVKYLPFAPCQSRHMSANRFQFGLLGTCYFMTRYGLLDCEKERARRFGFEQEILGTRLHSPDRGPNIWAAGEKNDGQGRAKLAQANL